MGGTIDASIEGAYAGFFPTSRYLSRIPRNRIRESKRKGVMKHQKKAAGGQKFCKQRVKETSQTSAFVLVYSLGDEMYKWTRTSSLKKFAEAIQEEYRFRNRTATARQHLLEADVTPFDGKRALREAEKELEERRQAHSQAQEVSRCHQAYRDAHGLGADHASAKRPSVGDRVCIVRTGEAASVVRDDRDHRPYRLQSEDGIVEGWFSESEVRRVSGLAHASTPEKRRRTNEHTDSSRKPKLPHHLKEHTDSSRKPKLPHHLKGELAPWGHGVDRATADPRLTDADALERALGVLGLDAVPNEVELRRAFRQRARVSHPDKVAPHLLPWATQEMQRINAAYNTVLAKLQGKTPMSTAQQSAVPAIAWLC